MDLVATPFQGIATLSHCHHHVAGDTFDGCDAPPARLRRHFCPWLDDHPAAHALKSVDQATLHALAVELVKVAWAKILVRATIPQQGVGNHQNSMSDRHGGPIAT